MTAETLLFFGSAPEALALYEGMEGMILSAFPGTRVIVQKSQIAFDCGRRFAFASLRGKRLVVSFGLGRREDSPRIAQAVEPYPGRWTHHTYVDGPGALDGWLMDRLREAHDFALAKTCRNGGKKVGRDIDKGRMDLIK